MANHTLGELVKGLQHTVGDVHLAANATPQLCVRCAASIFRAVTNSRLPLLLLLLRLAHLYLQHRLACIKRLPGIRQPYTKPGQHLPPHLRHLPEGGRPLLVGNRVHRRLDRPLHSHIPRQMKHVRQGVYHMSAWPGQQTVQPVLIHNVAPCISLRTKGALDHVLRLSLGLPQPMLHISQLGLEGLNLLPQTVLPGLCITKLCLCLVTGLARFVHLSLVCFTRASQRILCLLLFTLRTLGITLRLRCPLTGRLRRLSIRLLASLVQRTLRLTAVTLRFIPLAPELLQLLLVVSLNLFYISIRLGRRLFSLCDRRAAITLRLRLLQLLRKQVKVVIQRLKLLTDLMRKQTIPRQHIVYASVLRRHTLQLRLQLCLQSRPVRIADPLLPKPLRKLLHLLRGLPVKHGHGVLKPFLWRLQLVSTCSHSPRQVRATPAPALMKRNVSAHVSQRP